MRALIRRAVGLCWCLALAPSAVAGVVVGGVVTAPDGARLPGVYVRVVNLGTQEEVRVVSGNEGRFDLGEVAAGRYRLVAELDGFEPHAVDLDVGDGPPVDLRVQLALQTVRELVRVVGLAPPDAVEPFEIREARARDVGEALATVPGVTMLRKGAIANDVVVRGFQGKDVTVLIDGQRVDGACPGHMDPPAFHVDLAEVSRIELSKGPFDVKNQGGLAGAVNVVTQRPQAGWHGTGNVTVASADTLALAVAGSAGARGWSALGGASMRHASPYVDGDGVSMTARANYVANAVAGEPSYEAWTGWGRLAMVPRAGTTLQLSYTRQSADTILYPYLQMDALFDNANRAGARLEVAELPGGWGTLAAHAYYTSVDHWMTDEFRSTALGMPREYSMATRAETEITGGKVDIQRGNLTFGAEASRRRWDSRTMLAGRKYDPQAPLPDAIIQVAGAFAAYAVDAGDRWRLEAGARLDQASSRANESLANTNLYLAYHGTAATSATDVLPVGYGRAKWRHDSGVTLGFGVGHAARVPDQQERFYALQRAGSDWVGNPTLSPSRNTGADAEFRYARRGASASVSVFGYRVQDHLLVTDVVRVSAVPGVMNKVARSYRNVDAFTRGVEASGIWPLGRTVFLSGDVAAVRGTTEGDDLPEMPPVRGNLRVRFDNARWNGVLEVVGAAAQTHVATALQETPTPAFATVNAYAGFRVRQLEVTAGIVNLLDAAYYEHLSYQRDPFRSGARVYQPGRTLSATVTARF